MVGEERAGVGSCSSVTRLSPLSRPLSPELKAAGSRDSEEGNNELNETQFYGLSPNTC